MQRPLEVQSDPFQPTQSQVATVTHYTILVINYPLRWAELFPKTSERAPGTILRAGRVYLTDPFPRLKSRLPCLKL